LIDFPPIVAKVKKPFQIGDLEAEERGKRGFWVILTGRKIAILPI
jgi:hypothetical protein